jgi:hypothetical protein
MKMVNVNLDIEDIKFLIKHNLFDSNRGIENVPLYKKLKAHYDLIILEEL